MKRFNDRITIIVPDIADMASKARADAPVAAVRYASERIGESPLLLPTRRRRRK